METIKMTINKVEVFVYYQMCGERKTVLGALRETERSGTGEGKAEKGSKRVTRAVRICKSL